MKLLIIDTQKLITNSALYNFEEFRSNVKTLIKAARENSVEIIYVRHDDGEGAALTKGTEGFEIFDEFAPAEGERVFDKTVNSAFRDTGLLEYLREQGENQVMIVGLQTDYCIDASVKAAFEHGFEVIVPENCNTTFDNDFMTGEQTYRYYNEFMWNGRYAQCVSFEGAMGMFVR